MTPEHIHPDGGSTLDSADATTLCNAYNTQSGGSDTVAQWEAFPSQAATWQVSRLQVLAALIRIHQG